MVAGGCKEWCEIGEPIKNTEIFSLNTFEWKNAAELPIPLSSFQMTQFDGLPTTIGGVTINDNSKENDLFIDVEKLYQYHYDTNQWIPHPYINLTLPRSSAAVFQVPHYYFSDCNL